MLLEINVKLRRGLFDLTTQFSVNGTSVGLYGKSGAGKSTVLGLIAGLIQPQSGYIALGGKTLFDSKKGIMVPREQRPVGAVLQIDSAHRSETVHKNLLDAYNRTLKQRRIFTLNFLLQLLELEPILNHSIEQLSMGERQRVALARSLLKSPQLLLLDETFAAIGNSYRLQLLPLLKRLERELGLPVLYASQSLSEILELTDKLVVLENGKILLRGSLRDIAKQQGILNYLGIRQIDNLLTVTISSHNYVAGCSYAHSAKLPLVLPLRPHLAISSQTQVAIRAKDIALSRNYIEDISIQNQIKGRICALIPHGESIIVQMDCGETLLAEITPSASQDLGLQEGQNIFCLIKTHSMGYLAEIDTPPYQRVVSHGNGHYYLSLAADRTLIY
ncbi:MAG: ATP-binding cassette domain-containing protein [Methylococcaceae bacterium]|jgi:molybdate transport system ATP-binding protein